MDNTDFKEHRPLGNRRCSFCDKSRSQSASQQLIPITPYDYSKLLNYYTVENECNYNRIRIEFFK